MILKMRKLSGATENLIIPWQTTSSLGDFCDEDEDDDEDDGYWVRRVIVL